MDKVFNAFRNCISEPKCKDCPWTECMGLNNRKVEIPVDLALSVDALLAELLKKQDPVDPYLDFDGRDVWRCGCCHAALYHPKHTHADEDKQNCILFCQYCGRPVDWGYKRHKVSIQSLIDHIKTATDVDPWAKEMIEELLKKPEHSEPRRM